MDQTSEERRRFKVRAYVEDVLRSLQPRLKKTRHEVVLDCPDDLELDSYPGAFSQIITNLVMNSLDHGFEKIEQGRIILDFSREDHRVFFRYQDNGQGMDEETRKRVFDPFFTTKRGRGGSGLGMHIVYNLATQQLGGDIQYWSAPEKGESVTITMPVQPNTDQEKAV